MGGLFADALLAEAQEATERALELAATHQLKAEIKSELLVAEINQEVEQILKKSNISDTCR